MPSDKEISQDRRLDSLEEYYFNLDADPESLESFLKGLEFDGKVIWDRMQSE